MTNALLVLSFSISVLIIGLTLRLWKLHKKPTLVKAPLLLFLSLYCVQTLLLIAQLISLPVHLVELRPYLASLIPGACYWSVLVLSRKNNLFNIKDSFHVIPPILNGIELISFDISLICIQVGYALALVTLVYDQRLNNRSELKITVLLFAILFASISIFDLFTIIELANGGQLNESLFLFISLLVIYTLLIITASVAIINPSVLHQLLSDAQFAANTKFLNVENSEKNELQSDFDHIKSQLQKFEYYLEEGFDLNYLSDNLNIPVRQLSHTINSVAKKNFSAFINDLKVDKAKTLLLTTEQPITQIMYESGFTTKSNFNKEFSARTSVSPSVYRKASARL